MPSSRYEALPQDETNPGDYNGNKPPLIMGKQRSRVKHLWVIAFAVSVCFNLLLLSHRVLAENGADTKCDSRSSLVKFEDSLELPFPNRSHLMENDLLLDDPRFNLERGFVAVDISTAESHGFPRAQQWPWDESKGIYLLNSWHNLHCVVALRKSIKYAFNGQKMDDQADDTLRYTGPLYEQINEPVPHSGLGQKRRCHNWDELYEWAMENSACYNGKRDQPNLPELERYKSCPNGAEPWKDAL